MSFWNFLTWEWKYKILIKIPRNVVDDFDLCLWLTWLLDKNLSSYGLVKVDYRINLTYRHGMCFRVSSVFVLSILCWFPQRTHYFWRVTAKWPVFYITWETGTFQSALLFTNTISDPMTVTWQEEPVSERQTTYVDFHSARIIFDVSSGFYLWYINRTTTWHL
jgi:hypothetical protein